VKFPEQYRAQVAGPFHSDHGDTFGLFYIRRKSGKLRIIAADATDPVAGGWEHVSVSLEHRCPQWEEMCFVKSLFWEDDKCVVQYHPPKSDYVNVHPFTLHLWHYSLGPFPMPPTLLI
jgi:hypothetical protein